MKKFHELLKEISDTRTEITKSIENEERLTKMFMAEESLMERARKKKELSEELTIATERTRDLNISLALLKNNAKLALFAETVPAILEVLSKYKGKPYGEKTREKIREEMKARTDCNFWIGQHYSSEEYRISPVDHYGFDITIIPRYENGQCKRLLVDNKIQLVTAEDLTVGYINKQYFEDIPATIREMRSAYEKARAAQETLEAACSAFNKYSVDGLPHISSRENIYPRILV